MSWKKVITSGSNASLGSLTVTDLTVSPGDGNINLTQSYDEAYNFFPTWYFDGQDGFIAHKDTAGSGFPSSYIKFQTNGILNFMGGTSGGSITLGPTTNTIYNSGNHHHEFKTGDDNTIMVITGSNVGIGTASPEAKVNIVSSDTIAWTSMSNASLLIGTTDSGIGIDPNEIMSTGTLYLGSKGSTGNLDLRAGGTTKIFVSSSGNVGIGTISPGEKLEVVGNISASGAIIADEFRLGSSTGVFLGGDPIFTNEATDLAIQTGTGGEILFRPSETNVVELTNIAANFFKPINVTGDITASGNISSSGNVYASGFYVNGNLLSDSTSSQTSTYNSLTTVNGNAVLSQIGASGSTTWTNTTLSAGDYGDWGSVDAPQGSGTTQWLGIGGQQNGDSSGIEYYNPEVTDVSSARAWWIVENDDLSSDTGADGGASYTGDSSANEKAQTSNNHHLQCEGSSATGASAAPITDKRRHIFRTPRITKPATFTNFKLTFYFHAYGANIGTLKILHSSATDNIIGATEIPYTYWNGTAYVNGPITGQTHTSETSNWFRAEADLSGLPDGGRYLYFDHSSSFNAGTDYHHDLAIDSINIYSEIIAENSTKTSVALDVDSIDMKVGSTTTTSTSTPMVIKKDSIDTTVGINGPTTHLTHHRWSNSTATAYYIPFIGSTSEYAYIDNARKFLPPGAGKLKKITIRCSSAPGNIQFENWDDNLLTTNGGVNFNVHTANQNFHFPVDGENTFTAADILTLKYDPTAGPDNVLMILTWEFDTST